MDQLNNSVESRGCKFVKKNGRMEPVLSHGCCKFDSHDWMQNYSQPYKSPHNIIEVRFKNSRKEFFQNAENSPLLIGDIVAVESNPGHDIGVVSMTGKMVELKLKQKKINPNTFEFKKLYRRARATDVEKWLSCMSSEAKTMAESRRSASKLNLQMKINDVEIQGDGTKAFFYYTADERVDFRELIKIMADKFQVRIEMRQIGARQEANRLGGLGSCGRELCCSTWLNSFSSVSTNVARQQQLSLNPQRLSGQCSKLKCCLNYEADLYSETLRDFPDNSIILHTNKGDAYYLKTDVLKKLLWYTIKEHNSTKYFSLHIDNVKKIIEMNKQGKKPESLELFVETKEEETIVPDTNLNEELDIARFDKKKKQQQHNNFRRNPRNNSPNSSSNPQNKNNNNNNPNKK